MKKINLLIDCDPGHDDAIMLLIACHSDLFNIIGISSCSGNQTIEKTSTNINNLVHLFNRTDIPLAKGHLTPMYRETRICPEIHGESGLDGYNFPLFDTYFDEKEACDFIIEKLLNNDDVVVLTSGAMTNLGLAIQKNKTIVNHIKKIVLMGGSTGEGNITKAAEFNILVDPEAADICFKCGAPLQMLGLNVTRKILVTDEVVARAETIKTKGSDLFVKLMKVFNENQRNFFHLSAAPLHDPATIISLIDDEVFKFENMNVEIDISHTDQAGKTICKKTGKLNTLVATEVNIDKYWNVVMTYLERCR
ncbi:MAG: nucleoside hydrolase [Bacilli bacterium]|nr:nucleoside hydrolase [Bacilli bacterium]